MNYHWSLFLAFYSLALERKAALNEENRLLIIILSPQNYVSDIKWLKIQTYWFSLSYLSNKDNKLMQSWKITTWFGNLKVSLEVDQPSRSTYLLETDQETRSAYIWAYISCVHLRSICQSVLSSEVEM